MSDDRPTNTIRWKVHLTSSPDYVYRLLATPAGRKHFWAASAEQRGDAIEFHFTNGMVIVGRILATEPGRLFRLTYFDASVVTFQLHGDGLGGTDVELTEEGVSDDNWRDNLAGWVTVLLTLKAAADFGVDLRNHDRTRTWEGGWVDV